MPRDQDITEIGELSALVSEVGRFELDGPESPSPPATKEFKANCMSIRFGNRPDHDGFTFVDHVLLALPDGSIKTLSGDIKVRRDGNGTLISYKGEEAIAKVYAPSFESKAHAEDLFEMQRDGTNQTKARPPRSEISVTNRF